MSKLVEVQHLKQYFPAASDKLFERRYVKAVDEDGFWESAIAHDVTR